MLSDLASVFEDIQVPCLKIVVCEHVAIAYPGRTTPIRPDVFTGNYWRILDRLADLASAGRRKRTWVASKRRHYLDNVYINELRSADYPRLLESLEM